MVETLAYTYTSTQEIERIMSVDGLEFMQDDSASTPGTGEVDRDDLQTEFIAEATDLINLYVQGYYAPEDIYQNSWVRRQATWIGAYLYTRRRGNPGYYNDHYEQALEWLEMIRSGKFKIPRASERAVNVPTVSNLQVDDRYWYDKLRVDTSTAVGPLSGNQRQIVTFPYDPLF